MYRLCSPNLVSTENPLELNTPVLKICPCRTRKRSPTTWVTFLPTGSDPRADRHTGYTAGLGGFGDFLTFDFGVFHDFTTSVGLEQQYHMLKCHVAPEFASCARYMGK